MTNTIARAIAGAQQSLPSIDDDACCDPQSLSDQSVSRSQWRVAGDGVSLDGAEEAFGAMRHAKETRDVADELARLAVNERGLQVLEGLAGIPHDEAVQILELARKPENLEMLRRGEIPPELEPWRDEILDCLRKTRMDLSRMIDSVRRA